MSTSAARQWASLLGLGVVVMTTAVIVVMLAVQFSATPAYSPPAASTRIEISLDVGSPSRCVDPCAPALQAEAGNGAQRAA